jgi:23S rRNA (adenine2503-C2)-methyltransferase
MKKIIVPTGHICIMDGEAGKQLEFLSLGDYGKEKNLKADFLGLTNEINGVPHGELLPLEEKWVITISTQYGCSMNCKFCSVPLVGPGLNATRNDLVEQVNRALALHPEVTKAERINLHYARMGEPTWNENIFTATPIIAKMLKMRGFGFHPVISTMMPKNNPYLKEFVSKWIDLKNEYDGEAGLQISVNTTDKAIREDTMPFAMNIIDISNMFKEILNKKYILGRKITLNFALTSAPIDSVLLRELFDPEYFLCKITPMHNTQQAVKNKLITEEGYTSYQPYKKVEEELKEKGFDVIVFVPSKEEDESRITCGNAILADKNGI